MDAATVHQNALKRIKGISQNDLLPKRRKMIRTDEGGLGYYDSTFSASWRFHSDYKRDHMYPTVVDHSDPFSINNLLEELDYGEYRRIAKDIRELIMRRSQLLGFYEKSPEIPPAHVDVQIGMKRNVSDPATSDVIDLDDDDEDDAAGRKTQPCHAEPVVIIDSDDDTDFKIGNWRPPHLDANRVQSSESFALQNLLHQSYQEVVLAQTRTSQEFEISIATTSEHVKDRGEYVGTDEEMSEDDGELSDANSDGLGDIWNEMTVALECSKDASEATLLDEYDAGELEECEHSFILKDDIGDVCRICGVIKRGIATIIEYNSSKGIKNTRTARYEGRATRALGQSEILPDGFEVSDNDFTGAEINPHPRHMKEMKPHQIEGFNFLLSNLVAENPGGCIMAHAPGSGKTFMIISFLQSFMAKYPNARPLVVLPRGILAIWKKEFLRWQVEEIPLLDFYTAKADNRAQQLQVLKEWVKERSILFLGYKQFSSIVCDTDDGPIAGACQSYLLKVPTILILDEGHTPRNQDTDVLTSLERVETTRKVVLSGTLYQNHVREVFNILNLVRPKFLKIETSKAIRRRILSRAEVSNSKNLNSMKYGRDNEFFDLIEHNLIRDENHTRKVTVIQDLREMTKKVLHYYKGDNLDELPGLVDFAVFLQLSRSQTFEVKELKQLARKFKISAQGSAIYLHPRLKVLAKNSGVKERVDEEKINELLEKLDVKEGVKLNFYLNLLQLCESSSEKLLVFSQYLLPLKFLERITIKVKGYSLGREMFMITGDSDAETREISMEKFNTSDEARVFFGSIKACGEGISLVGASRILILDVHLNPSVTRQALGRAFRPGQVRKVYTYRLIASESPEAEDHATCFRKESIAKMWFEWDELRAHQNLELETVDVNNCGDMFLESARLSENVVAVYKR